MKNSTSLKIAGAVLASALSLMSARADLAINENVSLFGYAAGSIQYNKVHGTNTDTTMDIDAAKIGLALNFEPISATVSAYTDTGASELYLLDANISYDLGKNFTLTAGRFLTWFGYEAFDIPETSFITWSTATLFDSLMPDYHEGVKIEYTYGKHEFGLAILDSIYSRPGTDDPYRGDGSVRDGLGFELHYGYTAEKWSLGANLGYQYDRSKDSDYYLENNRRLIADVWGEYQLDDVTLAAEFYYKYEDRKGSDSQNTYFAMLMAKQDLSDKVSIGGRMSYGNEQDYGNFWKLSVMPVGYEVSNNLSIRSEVGYTRYSNGLRDKGEPKYEFFAGVQAVFKF